MGPRGSPNSFVMYTTGNSTVSDGSLGGRAFATGGVQGEVQWRSLELPESTSLHSADVVQRMLPVLSLQWWKLAPLPPAQLPSCRQLPPEKELVQVMTN